MNEVDNDEYIADIKFSGIAKLKELDQEIINKITLEINNIFKKYKIVFNHYEFMSINKKDYSIEVCDNCGNLIVNLDKNPSGIQEECFFDFIYNGRMFNGKNLCEICLGIEEEKKAKKKGA